MSDSEIDQGSRDFQNYCWGLGDFWELANSSCLGADGRADSDWLSVNCVHPPTPTNCLLSSAKQRLRSGLLLWHLTACHGVSLAQSSQDCPSQPLDKNKKTQSLWYSGLVCWWQHSTCGVLLWHPEPSNITLIKILERSVTKWLLRKQKWGWGYGSVVQCLPGVFVPHHQK